jgi:hypothetical protein
MREIPAEEFRRGVERRSVLVPSTAILTTRKRTPRIGIGPAEIVYVPKSTT